MRPIGHTSRGNAAVPVSVLVLAFSGAWSCGDGEELALFVGTNQPYPAGAAGESGTAGSGGVGDAGGAGGEPVISSGSGGEAATPPGAEGGTAGAGSGGVSAGGVPGSTGVAGTPTIPVVYCVVDSECSDGKFCNGVERCRERLGGSDIKICVRPVAGPCHPHDCDEEKKECDCDDPDSDGDGYVVQGCRGQRQEVDCDDDDENRNPGLTEVCDPDADAKEREHDEDCSDAVVGPDQDGDGYVDHRCSNIASFQPLPPQAETAGALVQLERIAGTDCDDDIDNVYPHAPEICDGHDNDCNGTIDEVFGETLERPARYFLDSDGDHYGNSEIWIDSFCLSPQQPYVNESGDCDDTDAAIGPQEVEVCNGIDDDCNGTVDRAQSPGAPLVDMPFEDGMTFECGGKDEWLVTSCPTGRLECNNPSYRDACETIGTTMCNCHACGAECNFACGESSCEEISEVSVGAYHTCAIARPPASLDVAGTVACWGRNAHGQLGTGVIQDSATPVSVLDLPRASWIGTGDAHSCAVAQGRIYCWGDNSVGQLGVDYSINSSPTPLVVTPPFDTTQATQVVLGSNHSCAIYDSGVLACWGAGDYGQLGINESGESLMMNTPARVRRRVNGGLQYVADTVQVVAGYAHTCSLSLTGAVECWGDNYSGQLGQDSEAVPLSVIPLPVPGLQDIPVDEIAASGELTCARAASEVLCWGSNWYGELARDGIDFSSSPVIIALPADVQAIALGATFGCASSTSGALYCWGTNNFGERGSADPSPGIAPTLVPLTDVIRPFAGGGSHACAIRENGAWCWGRHQFGQLGTDRVSEEMEPAPSRVQPLRGPIACNEP